MEDREETESGSIKPDVEFLKDTLSQLKAGILRVPELQRTYVWQPKQRLDLLDSIYKQYPIGQILVWKTEEDIKFRTEIAHVTISTRPSGNKSPAYLLDGQQRLTTLMGILLMPTERVTDPDLAEWRVFCDLNTLEFRYLQKGEEPTAPLFPMNVLLNAAAFIRACRGLEEHFINKAEELSARFTQYRISVVSISDVGLDRAVEIFGRLNSKGTPIRKHELAAALSYRQARSGEGAFKLDTEFEELAQLGEFVSFGRVEISFLLKAVLAALDEGDLYKTSWETVFSPASSANHASQDKDARLRSALAALKQTFPKAVRFLQEDGISSVRVLSYNMQLVMLAEFFRHCPEPSTGTKTLLSTWLWATSYQCWFGGASSSRIRECLKAIRDLAYGKENRLIEPLHNADALVDIPKSSSRFLVDRMEAAEPFPEKFDLKSARLRTFIAFYLSLKPRSLRTGEHLEADVIYASDTFRAFVYISRSRGSSSLQSSPANRILLSSEERTDVRNSLKELRSRFPADAQVEEILKSHAIPIAAYEALLNDKFETFLDLRQRELMTQEANFIKKKGLTPPSSSPPSYPQIMDETDEEEADELEIMF